MHSTANTADEAQMPEYFRIVRELSTQAGMPMPRLYDSLTGRRVSFAELFLTHPHCRARRSPAQR